MGICNEIILAPTSKLTSDTPSSKSVQLRKLRGVRDYRKEHLSEWAKDIDVHELLQGHDFRKIC